MVLLPTFTPGMETTDILIIGAGAAGLIAAYQLAKAGRKVIILEARGQTGGRIHTIRASQVSDNVELGAEFIHGKLPVTLSILNEAGITYHETGGEFWQSKNGQLSREEHFIEHWGELLMQLNLLKEDMSIGDFLDAYFSGLQYEKLRESVINFAEGYDTADIKRASSFALRDEWQSEDHAVQYRINEGYGAMTDYLANKIKELSGHIYINCTVKKIQWTKNQVTAISTNGQEFTGTKLIITAPINILQQVAGETGAIAFVPELPKQQEALQKLGMGAVLKILLQFSTPIWQDKSIQERTGNDMKNVAFLFSEQAIPTWWTQYPKDSALLTGWLGGPSAGALKNESPVSILATAIASLAAMLQLPPSFIREQLIGWHIANWTTEPFILGSYSYATVEAKQAIELLSIPVEDSIYFAGEAFYEGAEMGTVEAALASGRKVAQNILVHQ